MVSDDEFRAVEQDLREDVARHAALQRAAASAFCLYGAEYFSRGDGSDWWTYDGVTRTLGFNLPEQDLREAIAAGLAFWQRRVLAGGRGREYLATLVSEGGLPLALVQTEGGRLRRYFGDLLRQYETYPTMDVSVLAAELAGVLPVRMQNSVVYALATALVRHVAYLRDPTAHPGDAATWPVPLRIDSEVARELLDGLRSAPRPRANVETGIVVRTSIDLTGDPILRRQIELPRKISGQWLAAMMSDLPELPARWYLSVLTSAGTRWTVGVATSDDDGYSLRPLASRDIVRQGSVTKQVQCVVWFDGVDRGAFVPRGGESLSDTPWTFSDVDQGALLRATGSWRSSSPSLLVALPRDARFETEGDGVAERLGELVGLDRELVRLRGTLRSSQEGDEVVIASGAAAQAERAFELRGTRASQLVRDADVWLGCPKVIELDDHGVLRHLPAECLRWQRSKGSWTRDLSQALGQGELCASHDGCEFRTRLRILPPDFRLSLRLGASNRGTLEVRSAQVEAAGIEPSSDYTATVQRVTGGFDVEIVANQGAAVPATVLLALRMRHGSELSVSTPFPSERIAFIDRDGRVLPRDGVRSLDDLAHVRAVAISPQSGRWSIDLRAEDAPLLLAELPDLGGGLHEMSLEPLRPAISSALSASPLLNYEVQLRLERVGVVAGPVPTCRVRRYSAKLRPETLGEEHHVVLAADAAESFGDAVVASLRAEVVPLAEPDRTPTVLRSVARGRWSLDGLEPGAWLVLVYQNDYLRTCPLRITVAGPIPSLASDPIALAMRVQDAQDRRVALDASIAGLGNDTAGSGWSTVRRLLSTLGRYPASTFDVIPSVTRCPRIAVLSLLDAGPNAPTLWTGLEELPFLWVAIPIKVWLEAIGTWLAALRAHLPRMPDPDFARIVSTSSPVVFSDQRPTKFLGCIHDAAFLLFSGLPEPRDRWVFGLRERAARAMAASLTGFGGNSPLALERNLLLTRHLHGFWPSAVPFEDARVGRELTPLEQSCVTGQPAYQVNVLTVPLILAERVVGRALPCDLLTLRQIRDFDPEWFDFAFALALSILLGKRYERKEAPFNE
jgi:hypothetical protein